MHEAVIDTHWAYADQPSADIAAADHHWARRALASYMLLERATVIIIIMLPIKP
jgi:hypothetical protein